MPLDVDGDTDPSIMTLAATDMFSTPAPHNNPLMVMFSGSEEEDESEKKKNFCHAFSREI
jgi:hypothetical protein